MPEANAPKLAVVGSCNIDLTFRVARLPRAGETLAGSGFQLGHGGKGANQAVMAARLGADVCMIGCVGRDTFGDDALANFRRDGIDVSHISRVADLPTGSAAILVDDAGQNCIVVVPGANAALTPADIQHSADAIRSADVLLCQLEVPVATTQAALRIARDAGVRTIFNPAPALPLPAEFLALVDVCIPNETELAHITGHAVDSPAALEEAARRLRERGPRAVVVTLGERGVLLLDDSPCQHLPAPMVQAVDSSGAGDAFIGAFAVSWIRNGSLREAAKQANEIAADTVTRPGTQTSFPRSTTGA